MSSRNFLGGVVLVFLMLPFMESCLLPASRAIQAQEPEEPQVLWEKLQAKPWTCYRAEVPGGWLVRVGDDQGMGLTFMPDPEHKWLDPDWRAPEAQPKPFEPGPEKF